MKNKILLGIEILNTLTQISPELSSSIVKLGGSRILISKLEDSLATKKVALNSLKLLDNIASVKKDALKVMNNQS